MTGTMRASFPTRLTCTFNMGTPATNKALWEEILTGALREITGTDAAGNY